MKNIFLIWLALTVTGCAASNIRHDVTPPPGAPASAPVEYAGVYRGEMPFRALTMSAADGQRVVVLSDLGAKLLDMKIMENSADIYFRAAFVPQSAVKDFVNFFRALFWPAADGHGEKISREVLWVKSL